MNLRGRHFLTLRDFSAEEIIHILDTAAELKSGHKLAARHLERRSVVLIFQKPSLRTRVSFEVGIQQLGGHPIYMDDFSAGIGRREPASDMARVLSRYVAAIIARVFEHSILEELARASEVPVINALSDFCHPCQVLADLLTIREKLGGLKGKKLAYVGDGNNVAVSLLYGATRTGMSIFMASPEGYRVPHEVFEEAEKETRKHGQVAIYTSDPLEAVREADVIYTDVWASMGQEKERETRKRAFKDYQVNEDLLQMAPPGAIVMHCLPAHYGEEITKEVAYGPRSVIFDQAENRLHAQKALMFLII